MKLQDVGVMDVAADPRMTLGDTIPFFFYRFVTLFAVADSMGARARDALTGAGHKVAEQLATQMHYRSFSQWADHFRQHGLGILTLEEQTPERVRFRLDECATCSGLPKVGMTLCCFEAGMLTVVGQQVIGATGGSWQCEEVECSGLGHGACVFEVTRA